MSKIGDVYKMKKTISYGIGLLLLVSLVVADVNIGVGLQTPEDIHGDFYLDAGGNIYLNIDGMNYAESQNQIYSTMSQIGRPMSSIFTQFSDVFIERDSRTDEYYFVPYDELQNYEQRFRWTMTQYILSTTENQMKDKLDDYDFYLEMFKGQFSEEEWCQMMIETAKRLKMSEIVCGGTKYNIDYKGTVFVTQSILEPEDIEEEKLTQPQRLCKSGLKSFCSGYDKPSYTELICPDGDWIDGSCII